MKKSKEQAATFKPGKYLPGFLLWEASMMWQRFLTAALSEIDLTPVQFYVISGLEKLSHIDNAISQIELANFLQMNVMMTSKVVRTLEQKECITRIEHPEDTRAKCLVLTEKGKELRKKAIDISCKANEDFFGTNDENVEEFIAFLKKIIEK